jgi:putative protease
MRDMQKVLPAEAIVYGRLPLMLTENCLIENNGCGCRCDRPNFLRDRTGAMFPLLAAYGHRNEVQNCKALWLADRSDWRRLGLSYARLRFTTETPASCAEIIRAYLTGGSAPGEFTRGLYERGVE